jgi:hypothetical protein
VHRGAFVHLRVPCASLGARRGLGEKAGMERYGVHRAGAPRIMDFVCIVRRARRAEAPVAQGAHTRAPGGLVGRFHCLILR